MSDVHFEIAGPVAIITIDRPRRRNAIDGPAAEAIARGLDELDARDDLRVGVLTGAGPTFCAGMDLKALTESGARPQTKSRGLFGIVERPPEKPLIAAVEGAAFGGGLEVALACDLIVAASDARFGFPEVTRGLVPSAGGAIRLPRRIPTSAALEMLMTGEPIDATEAHRLGLVNRLCEPGSATERARALAESIAANAPLAVRVAKWIAGQTVTLSVPEAFARQSFAVQTIRESEDAREGTLAFVQKRAPVWSAR